ncbi:unnamed protein product, partial [Cylicocyclus nassatus]
FRNNSDLEAAGCRSAISLPTRTSSRFRAENSMSTGEDLQPDALESAPTPRPTTSLRWRYMAAVSTVNGRRRSHLNGFIIIELLLSTNSTPSCALFCLS